MRSSWFIIPAAMLAFASCGPTVKYEDPGRVETVTAEYGVTDLQRIVDEVGDAVLVSNVIAQSPGKPIMMIGDLQNKTPDPIDLNTLARKLRSKLINSGKVRFVAREEIKGAPEALQKELDFQLNSGMVNKATARQLGQAIGAGYYLTGFIDSIRKREGDKIDQYYIFDLELVDVETWEVVLSEIVEIRKIATR